MTALGIIGVILGVGLIIFFAAKNISLLITAPLCAVIIALFNRMNPYETIMGPYMDGVGLIIRGMFYVMTLGLLFANIYSASGAGKTIANTLYRVCTKKARAAAGPGEQIRLNPAVGIGVLYLICIIMGYGGIGAVVISVTIIPIAFDIFRACDLPNEMIPGCIMGATAAGVPSMPGTTSDQNIMAINLLGTGSLEKPLVGFLVGILILVANYLLFCKLGKKNIASGNRFSLPDDLVGKVDMEAEGPHIILTFLPMILIFVLFNVVKVPVVVAILCGDILAILLFKKHLGSWKDILKLATEAFVRGGSMCLIGANLSGVGKVVAASPSFDVITHAIVTVSFPVMFKACIAVMICTMIAGGGPTGLSIALPNLSGTFASLGVPMGTLHRISVFACQTLDTLPTNVGLILNCTLAHTTMDRAYKYIFYSTVLMTTAGALLASLLFTLGL